MMMATKPVVIVGLTVPMSVGLLGDRLRLMLDAGMDVHIIVGNLNGVAPEFPDRVSVHYLPISRSISPFRDSVTWLRWLRLVRRIQPDLVLGATPKGAMFALTTAYVLRVPIRVFEIWGAPWDGKTGLKSRLLRFVDKLSARTATRTISVSRSLSALLLGAKVTRTPAQVLGRGASKGVDLHRFTPCRINQRLYFYPTIGFIGRISGDKGIADLLAVFDCVRQTHQDAQLLIVGDFDDSDPVSDDLRFRIESDANVSVTGWTPSPETWIPRFTVHVFPSAREGLPNAILEASSCEIPSVAYDVTGIQDAIVENETGILVPFRDVSQLCMRSLFLINNEELRLEMGHSARRFVKDFFDSELVSAGHVSFLLRLLRDC